MQQCFCETQAKVQQQNFPFTPFTLSMGKSNTLKKLMESCVELHSIVKFFPVFYMNSRHATLESSIRES